MMGVAIASHTRRRPKRARRAGVWSDNQPMAGSVIASCSQEGIHWEADQHQCLADALAPLVKELL